MASTGKSVDLFNTSGDIIQSRATCALLSTPHAVNAVMAPKQRHVHAQRAVWDAETGQPQQTFSINCTLDHLSSTKGGRSLKTDRSLISLVSTVLYTLFMSHSLGKDWFTWSLIVHLVRWNTRIRRTRQVQKSTRALWWASAQTLSIQIRFSPETIGSEYKMPK